MRLKGEGREVVEEVKEVRRRRGSCGFELGVSWSPGGQGRRTHVELRAEDGGSVKGEGDTVDLDESLTLLQ